VTTARRRPALRLAVASGVNLAAVIDAFLSRPDLASTTRAKYRQTLTVLESFSSGVATSEAAVARPESPSVRAVRVLLRR